MIRVAALGLAAAALAVLIVAAAAALGFGTAQVVDFFAPPEEVDR